MSKLTKIKQNAAGIDLGSNEFFVSVDGETVKSFETFTSSIIELINYLKDHGIKTIAMESTGILWLPLYDMLEKEGFEVFLVNAAHAKNVPAQKSDPADCRWLQRLHSYGLLRASFVPKDDIRKLRMFVRLREDHLEMAASHIQHMQKAMELMNLKLKNVISQLHGVSGRRIIEAIISGDRNPEKLAALCDASILKHKKDRVIASLNGNYKEEYVFMLKQAYKAWLFYQNQILECDKQIENLLNEVTKNIPQVDISIPKPSRHNRPQIDGLHEKIIKLNKGKNATQLPGISDTTMLKLTAELGFDYSKWPTEKHFTSWLGLSPKKHQSGKTKKRNRNVAKTKAGQIFKECAMSIANSKYLALKGFYHRIKTKHGVRAANKATARKLAVLYYRFMTKGMDYVEIGLKEYENRYKEIMIRNLNKKANDLGFQIVAA
jgi:transposase